MRLVIVLIAAFASVINAADQCSVVNANQRKTSFLERVQALNGKSFSVVDGNATYKMKWCGDVSTQPKAAVIKDVLKEEHVIGRYNETDVITIGGWNIVTFAGGDFINSTDHCNATQWKAVILIECHPGTVDNLTLVDSMNAGCFAVFHLNTSAVCPVVPTPPAPLPPQEHTSRWTVFFMLVITAGICYLAIGMAYRRFVLGAKGFEQIPNYDFWRDPCGYTRDYCNRRDMQRNEPWSNSPRVNDSADEPLLHP